MSRDDCSLPRRRSLGRLILAAGALPVLATLATRPAEAASDEAATQAVFDHHLGAFAKGIDALMADYTEASVIVTPQGSHAGLAEIRTFFEAFLATATPEFWQQFKILSRSVKGDVAYLVWSSKPAVPMATDTLLVRNGKILVQTFTPFQA
jgi:hypothetical protein